MRSTAVSRARVEQLAAQAADLGIPAGATEVVTAWLGEQYVRSVPTGGSYASAMSRYLAWCAAEDIDPLLINRMAAGRFASYLGEMTSDHTGRELSDSYRSTITTACTRLLEYAVAVEARPDRGSNPFASVPRPRVYRKHRAGPRLAFGDVARLVLAARADHVLGGTLGKTIVGALMLTGIRPADLCRLDEDQAVDDGHGGYELRLTVKRGKPLTRWLPPQVAADLYTYKARHRIAADVPEGQAQPLLVHPKFRRRITKDDVLRLVKRCAARAELDIGASLTAREFRSLWQTTASVNNISLEDRQTAAGHDDPRTTQGYDLTAWTRDRDPSIKLAALIENYPSEELAIPLAWATATGRRDSGGKNECDCVPAWGNLLVWLGDIHPDLQQTARAVPVEDWPPGVITLPSAFCPACHARYPGPYRVTAIPGNPDNLKQDLLDHELGQRHLYPGAMAGRDERRRQHDEQTGTAA
ncbi:site-specific integrase [Pseudonocardiaceae bacterium YIM PH 21723]|nr:site-specific integrase [Pseudonocardiaceae bacterium YIM PH 21723]